MWLAVISGNVRKLTMQQIKILVVIASFSKLDRIR